MSRIGTQSDKRTISTEELRNLLKTTGVSVGRYVSTRAGEALVELRQRDGPTVTVKVSDRP